MNVIVGVYIFVVGTIFASFFGVIVDRVPQNKSIVTPSSSCDNCGHVLRWYENIPVLSYLFLGGKCSNCKTKIDSFLFIYELIGGLSLLLVYLKYGLTIECILIELITLIMLLIAGYDYKTNTILNIFLYILFALCLTLCLYRIFVLNYDYRPYIFSCILGLVFFLLVKIVMSKILKKEAMGLGDVLFAFIIGLVFQPFEQLLGILVSSTVGSIISIIMIQISKNNRDTQIPFCPYLCLGYYSMFILGDILTKLLLR